MHNNLLYVLTSSLLLLLPQPSIAADYTNQKYIVRQLWPDNSCSGSAAVAQAIELNKCFPSVGGGGEFSIEYTIVGDNLVASTYLSDDTCSGKPFGKPQQSSISSKCQASPNIAHTLTGTTEGSDTSYSSYVFTNTIPDASLGYPYLQTNYTAATKCNTSQFNTPILFHQDATDTCLKAATLAYSNAQAIRITKGTKSGFHIDTAFGIEYYDTTSCGSSSLISKFHCPAHCTTYDQKEYVPTSVSCMTVALIVADDSFKMVLIAVVCVIGILGLGYAAFVYMRRKAEYDPSSFGQWIPNESGDSNSYSTFHA